MKLCKNCGTKLDNKALFCYNCGDKQEEEIDILTILEDSIKDRYSDLLKKTIDGEICSIKGPPNEYVKTAQTRISPNLFQKTTSKEYVELLYTALQITYEDSESSFYNLLPIFSSILVSLNLNLSISKLMTDCSVNNLESKTNNMKSEQELSRCLITDYVICCRYAGTEGNFRKVLLYLCTKFEISHLELKEIIGWINLLIDSNDFILTHSKKGFFGVTKDYKTVKEWNSGHSNLSLPNVWKNTFVTRASGRYYRNWNVYGDDVTVRENIFCYRYLGPGKYGNRVDEYRTYDISGYNKIYILKLRKRSPNFDKFHSIVNDPSHILNNEIGIDFINPSYNDYLVTDLVSQIFDLNNITTYKEREDYIGFGGYTEIKVEESLRDTVEKFVGDYYLNLFILVKISEYDFENLIIVDHQCNYFDTLKSKDRHEDNEDILGYFFKIPQCLLGWKEAIYKKIRKENIALEEIKNTEKNT